MQLGCPDYAESYSQNILQSHLNFSRRRSQQTREDIAHVIFFHLCKLNNQKKCNLSFFVFFYAFW